MIPYLAVTVFISFRFDSGTSIPRDKSLRARVMQDGRLGTDLIAPTCNDLISVKSSCIKNLKSKTSQVDFVYDSPVQDWILKGGKKRGTV